MPAGAVLFSVADGEVNGRMGAPDKCADGWRRNAGKSSKPLAVATSEVHPGLGTARLGRVRRMRSLIGIRVHG